MGHRSREPLVSGRCPLGRRALGLKCGVCVRVCVCARALMHAPHVCFRTEGRIRHITAPWGDRLPFSFSTSAACGFPPECSFPHSSFPSLALVDSEFLSSPCSTHPKTTPGLSLHKASGYPQPGYLAESTPRSYGYNVGLVSEVGDLLSWAADLPALRQLLGLSLISSHS